MHDISSGRLEEYIEAKWKDVIFKSTGSDDTCGTAERMPTSFEVGWDMGGGCHPRRSYG